MSKRVIIRQAAKNKSMIEIFEERVKVIELLKEKGYEIVESPCVSSELQLKGKPIENDINNLSIYFISERLKEISKCDTVCFCKDWEKDIICNIEHGIAKMFNLDTIYIR